MDGAVKEKETEADKGNEVMGEMGGGGAVKREPIFHFFLRDRVSKMNVFHFKALIFVLNYLAG